MAHNFLLKGERFNSISHLIGAVLAFVGLAYLMLLSVNQADLWRTFGFCVYGTTLLMLYSLSAAYHSHCGESKALFRKLDHLTIYLFIAGSYMPFTLVTLREDGGLWLSVIIWALAVGGMICEFTPKKGGLRILPILIYLGMGWMILFLAKPLAQQMPDGIWWLVLGGVLYTVGVLFYVFDKKVKHFHGVWHLFVMLGSISHFYTVVRYV